jgi:predicted RND superfamily exporter protein
MLQRLFLLPVRHPFAALALTLAVTIGFATQIPKLEVESDWTQWIPVGDDALTNLEGLEEVFGSSYLVRILIVRDDHPDGIYNPQTLGLIAEITEWVRSRPELETAANADLRSLSSVNRIRGDESGLIVEPFMETPPKTRAEALAVREAIETDGIYHGLVAAYDGKAAAIMVRESRDMRATPAATYYAVRAYLDELEARGIPEKLHITGRPIIEGLFDIYIPQEGYRILPFVFLMLAVLLYATFRTVRAVVLPMLVIVATEIWMLGFLAAWGHPMYSVTSILPIIIVSISVADSIHLVATYYLVQQRQPAADRRRVLELTLADMNLPVFLTSLTTVIGFSTMTTSSLAPIRDFGVVGAFGVTAAWLITMLLVPALFAVLPLRGAAARAASSKRLSLDALLVRPAAFCTRMALPVIAIFVGVLCVAALGTTRLGTDSSQVGQFPPNHHLRYADTLDNRHFAGSSLLDVWVDSGVDEGIKDPATLARIGEFQRRIEELDLVRDSFSIAELIGRMNRVMNEDRPAEDRIPEDRDLIAQYLLLYSMSGDPGDFDDLVDYDYRHAHLLVFINDPGTAAARTVVARANEIAAQLFGSGSGATATVRLAGGAHVNSALETYIVESQIWTLVTGLPVLFFLSWFVFRGPLVGLLCIAPISLAVALIYGTMGYVGLPADIGTAMLGGMTLGIGIDFAIHYLHRYRDCAAHGMGAEEAAVETARTAGRALFYNAVVLIGGFIVLLGARLYPQIKLGVLVSSTMVICYAATMLLFPAALGLLARRRSEAVASAELAHEASASSR